MMQTAAALRAANHAVYMTQHEILMMSNVIYDLNIKRRNQTEHDFLQTWLYDLIDFIKELSEELSWLSNNNGVDTMRHNAGIKHLLRTMRHGLTGCLVYQPPDEPHTHTEYCWKIHEHLLLARQYIGLAMDAVQGLRIRERVGKREAELDIRHNATRAIKSMIPFSKPEAR